jgi:hypothetical protein
VAQPLVSLTRPVPPSTSGRASPPESAIPLPVSPTSAAPVSPLLSGGFGARVCRMSDSRRLLRCIECPGRSGGSPCLDDVVRAPYSARRTS